MAQDLNRYLLIRRTNLPEGNRKRVGFCPLPHKESPITRNSHQHVFCMAPGEVGMVPPGTNIKHRQHVISGMNFVTSHLLFTLDEGVSYQSMI